MKRNTTRLTINGLAICGIVGKGSMRISIQDAWIAYLKHSGNTKSLPPWWTYQTDDGNEKAVWRINGDKIDLFGWFIEIAN